MSERLTASPSGRCVTEGPMLVAPREVLVCCVLPWSFPARVSCPWLRFGGMNEQTMTISQKKNVHHESGPSRPLGCRDWCDG